MTSGQKRTRWRRASIGLAVVTALALLIVPWCHRRLRAAALFLRMEGAKNAPGWLLHYGEHTLGEQSLQLPSGAAAIVYAPEHAGAAPGVVLAHGIHDEGIHEARLVRLARAVASSGFTVLTPELSDLASYRVTHAGAETIAEAARTLAERLGQRSVTVFGISFGGGLALRAACEPSLRGAIGRVITLGAHHQADTIARFFLGEPARAPDGSVAQLTPHSYGGTVLFAWLFAEKHRGKLKPGEVERVRAALGSRADALRAASPAHCPRAVRVPVHLAHGLGDSIVPYTETLWNAAALGAQTSVEVLVTPVLGHAEYAAPTAYQRFQLVDFMAKALP